MSHGDDWLVDKSELRETDELQSVIDEIGDSTLIRFDTTRLTRWDSDLVAFVWSLEAFACNREVELHLRNCKTSGAELIMGSGRFVAPKVVEVHLNDGGTRLLAGDKVFLNLGTHPAVPDIPELGASRPRTHIEVLELDYLPTHLLVFGGGHVDLEMAQAWRRFGSRVTVIEPGPRIMSRENPEVADELHKMLRPCASRGCQ